MKKYIFILSLLASFLATAQKHDKLWILGFVWPSGDYTFAIDFEETPPVTYFFNSNLSFRGSPATMSDSDGNLLYYSNGRKVYNKQKTLMENGDSLKIVDKGNYQEGLYGAFSLPNPANNGQYYLFYQTATTVIDSNDIPDVIGDSLMYCLIDMNANNGLGKVIKKNKAALTGDFKTASVVKHGNGRDWWIVGANSTSTTVTRALLSPTGISIQEVQTYHSQPVTTVSYYYNHLFSPLGNKILDYYDAGINIHDFNRCTGVVSENYITINTKKPACFSPNERFLYANFNDSLVQYDLWSDNPNMTKITVAYAEENYSFGNIVNTIDGKIYVGNYIWPEGNTSLNIINNPDSLGVACDVCQKCVILPAQYYVLPWVTPNYRLYDDPNSPCDTLGINAPVPVAVQAPPAYAPLFLSPNPTSGDVQLTLPIPLVAATECYLYDVTGRLVQRSTLAIGTTTSTLSMAALPSGMYVCQVGNWKGKVIVAH